MITIPTNSQWSQTNRSDILGSLVGTFNLDLTKVLGKTRVTRMIQTTTQVTNTNLTNYPVGFKIYNDGAVKLWTVAGSKVHSASNATRSAFAVDATSGSPTTCSSLASDIEVFNGALYVTTFDGTGDKIVKNLSGTWSTNAIGLGAVSGTHMLTVYANKLYISRGRNSIYMMDSSDVVTADKLTLDSNYNVTCMRSASNRIWICTIALTGKGYVYEWDGAAAQVTRGYRLESQGALACVIKDDVPWIVDTNGRLCVYSNGTFVEKARFPLNNQLLAQATDANNDRFIHPNGMTVIDGKINILINNVLGDNTSITEFCPSGVWEFDESTYNPTTGATPGIGLYHKYSLSYLPVGTNTITDWGQNRVSGVGALSEMKIDNSGAPNASNTGSLLAGAVVYTNASSTDTGIFTNDIFNAVSGTTGQYATQGSGYFVTTQIQSSQIKESWQKLVLFYKKFLTSTDSIVAKARTNAVDPTYFNLTWTNTTQFETTTNLGAYAVGDEIEILQGTGSGMCSHISAIGTGGIGYQVTVDTVHTGVTTGTAKGRAQYWKKFGTINNQTSQFDIKGINLNSTWIQLKIHLIFSGPNEFEKAILISKPEQLAL